MLLRRRSEGVCAHCSGSRGADAPGHVLPVEDAAVETAGIRPGPERASNKRGDSPCKVRGRTEYMGKVGRDGLGKEMVELIDKEKVGTRGVKVDGNGKTGCSYMRVKFDEDEGKVKVETVRESAEDSFISSELNLDVLKEVIQLFSCMFSSVFES